MNNKIELKYIDNIQKRVGRIIYKHKLIVENDKIMVALSGGKDSFILLETLVNRKKYLPFKFELFACYVHFTNVGYDIDTGYLQNFCAELKVPLIIKEQKLDLSENNDKSVCFVCSWYRRKLLFECAREKKCNKLAFGHHMDDALETLFLNMVYHASISSLPYKLKMFEGRMEIIRPLLILNEKELLTYSEFRDFKKENKNCPYQDDNKRNNLKELLSHFEKLYPKFKKNLFNSMGNIYTEYLPKK